MDQLNKVMDARDFCYWLNGFAEVAQPHGVDDTQWKAITEHLDIVDVNSSGDDRCIDAVLQIKGYVSVTGGRTPSPSEWKGIVDIVTSCFEKITGDTSGNSNGLEENLEEIVERINKAGREGGLGPFPIKPQRDPLWPEYKDDKLICSVQEERHDRLGDVYADTPSYKLGEHSQGYTGNGKRNR